MSVGAIVTADGEAAGRRAFCMYGPRCLRILFDVGGGCNAAVGQDGQYGKASTVVVRYQNIFSGRVDAEVSRPSAFRTDDIQSSQAAGAGVYGVRGHSPGVMAVEIRDFVCGVQILSRRMERKRGGIPFVPTHLLLGQRTRGRIHVEDVDAFAISVTAFGALRRAIGS